MFGFLIGIGILVIVFVLMILGVFNDGFLSIFYYVDQYVNDIFVDQGMRIKQILVDIMFLILLIFVVLVVCVIIVLVLQQGIVFLIKKIQLDVKKLLLIENIKKKYGVKGLFDFFKDVVKMCFVGLIVVYFLFYFVIEYYGVSVFGCEGFGEFMLNQIFKLIFYFFVFQVVLVFIDLLLQ